MPKRTDLHSILIIGAGPIVIGQACEFDYAGVQACKALKEEGYRLILVNSNPATIMTDANMADVVYIEPLQWSFLEKIIEKERPDALLPTMGGQTALNCTLDLYRRGILAKYQVELIGASIAAIDKAEDRALFRQAMNNIGLTVPRSQLAHSLKEALEIQSVLGFPTVVRPSFTLGGSGGGIAYHLDEFIEICKRGLSLSPIQSLLIEESILGWKEFELEVVRDKNDNCIIVCSIENIDPVGVHTGDSATVAPALTLRDKEYQQLRNASIAILREIGVETGGANVQFAINPVDGRMMVIEMNPRVSRSSALASKATGFPIAKVAAKLAVGYTLDELRNEMTGEVIPASFEPSIDYVVTKLPRFNFEKFKPCEDSLTTQMKSVGEVMAIGRTFQESFQKALCSLEVGCSGFDEKLIGLSAVEAKNILLKKLKTPNADRFFYIADAFRHGFCVVEVAKITGIDAWFLAQIQHIIFEENKIKSLRKARDLFLQWKKQGFSDKRLATLWQVTETDMIHLRREWNIHPVYKRVDSCAGEFPAQTTYLYSTYESECEAKPTDSPKIIVLGSGPNRIGQGIEFDYCCVHAAQGFSALGYETIMVNCNPETVSTDYDISDRLYFEPLTLSHVLSLIELEKPTGVVVQFGGQTPLKLADKLSSWGVPLLGTSASAIHLAEDREQFHRFIQQLGLKQPESGIARTEKEGLLIAERLTFPIIVRPSYVLGGRAMQIVYNAEALANYLSYALQASEHTTVLLDKYIEDAVEVDVDALCDGQTVRILGIMEHIEPAGIHSGDSACVMPPYNLSLTMQTALKLQVEKIALALPVIGLVNVQFAIQGDEIYVLEVNPRASRTVPFVAKALGIPVVNMAAKVVAGLKLKDLLPEPICRPLNVNVKLPVFPFMKFPGVDPMLGPEMKSTGEVMGIASSFEEAYAKALAAANVTLPTTGCVLISVRDKDKANVVALAHTLSHLGFSLLGTKGTATFLKQAGLSCDIVSKIGEGNSHLVDSVKNKKISLIIHTADNKQDIVDTFSLRYQALLQGISYVTSLRAAKAIVDAIYYPLSCTISA